MNQVPRRVLFPFVGDRIGGSHRSALLLLQNLRQSTFEPVVVLHEEGPLSARLQGLGISFHRIPLPCYVGESAGPFVLARALCITLPRLRRFLRRERIDIVHSHDARMHLTWLLPARLAGCQMVWHQRTKFPDWRLFRLAARLAHRIVCISDYGAQTVPQNLRKNTVSIANPLETSAPAPNRTRARERLLREFGAEPDAVIVGFVANLTTQKRPMVFVEAAAKINELSNRPCHFCVFGEDRQGLTKELKHRAAQLNLGERLHFAGFQSDIEARIAGCDLVLAPAVEEAFGRVLIESMLVGTPVVAADSGGHGEIIENNVTGWLVPPDDPEAFATAALSALQDRSGTQQVIAAAQTEASSKYTVAAHVEGVEIVYDALSAPTGRGTVTSPIDIAFVIADLGSGGSQRVVTTLANAWAQLGRKVGIVTFAGREADFFRLDPSVARWTIGGADSANMGLPRRLLANFSRLRALRRVLRAAQPKSVVSFILPTNVLTVLATVGMPNRIILSERNDPKRQLLGHHWNLLRWILYRQADLVTANSLGALAAMKSYVPEAKLAYVPNPLSLPTEPAAKRMAHCKGRAPTILAVGRLHEQKGYDLLIEAFKEFATTSSGWQLRIVGDGPLRDALRKQAESAGIDKLVHWEGRIADPYPYYRDAEIFVMPSRYEGTPNALLEAMSCGLPVVVSDASPGPLEYVENNVTGLVVPVGNTKALAKALDSLARDPALRRRLAEAGRKKASSLELDAVLPVWEGIIGLAPMPQLSGSRD